MLCKQTNPPIFNTTQCAQSYEYLPSLIQAIRLAYDVPTVDNRLKGEYAMAQLESGDLHGVMRENIRKKVNLIVCGAEVDQCDGTLEDCFPMYIWMEHFLNGIRAEVSEYHHQAGINPASSTFLNWES
jgi:hypothetical protein